MVDRTCLTRIADEFDRAPRLGSDEDVPEGSRYLMVTDTLARELARVLRDAAALLTQLQDAAMLRSLPGGFLCSAPSKPYVQEWRPAPTLTEREEVFTLARQEERTRWARAIRSKNYREPLAREIVEAMEDNMIERLK
jgi:hypothetical protein